MTVMAEIRDPRQRRYPPELRERAVRRVWEATEEGGDGYGVIPRVAHELGIGVESLRGWVKQAEIDAGRRGGLTSEERRRLVALEKENRELHRANEILKAFQAFRERALDPREPRP